ncbi:MAG TPA: hypothetical protein PLR60_04365 [Syntrophorhabdaceae bacterium]|nr:hypothetical protein [Syntrophorhabdaceae bacterium]
MVGRRKRRDDGSSISLQQSSPVSVMSPEAPSPNVSVGTDHRIPFPSPFTDTIKKVFEKAVDRARNELLSSGKIGLAVFFVYANGMMNVGRLFFKDKLHEELLKRRIREKALAENASAVLLLTEGGRPGTILLSGTAPGMRVSACVDYVFDKNTKAITSWEPHWLDNPLKNAFLDGIFDTTS